MRSTKNKFKHGILRIFQANTARGQANHDLALALANSEAVDVILIQEPWTLFQREKKITKQRTNYMPFSPIDTWETRPRVMTYVRKGTNLQPIQLRPSNTADICWIKILGATPQITIVNVYRPPQESESGPIITTLKQWKAPPNSVIAGDFNTGHPSWDSHARDSRRAEELVEWSKENSLILSSPVYESTHNKGSVLDLVFTNIIGTQYNIEEHLHTTSDHETLLTTIPLRGYAEKSPVDKFKLTPEDTPRLRSGIKETLKTEKILTQDLDSLALMITECIRINMERFLPRKNHKNQGTKWWNADCREKAGAYRRARKFWDATMEKHDLRKATRSAKKAHWQRLIQNANSPSDIFKITRWHKSSATFSNPPINYEGQIYDVPIEKASILTKALLQRRTSSDDIVEDHIPLEYQARIQVHDKADELEVERCLLHVTSSAPGFDGLSVRVLRACWEEIKYAVVILYQRCLTDGYHPKIFRKADLVMLPKPNKRDLSSVRSWRPIALLSCLGKGLERLIARRLSLAAINQKVLNPQQFGALPKDQHLTQ